MRCIINFAKETTIQESIDGKQSKKVVKRGIEEWIAAIPKGTTLLYLRGISTTTLSCKDLKTFLDAIKTMSIIMVDIRLMDSSFIKAGGFVNLLTSLESTTVETLNLSNCCLNLLSPEALKNLILDLKNTGVKTLNLSENDLHEIGRYKVVQHFYEMGSPQIIQHVGPTTYHKIESEEICSKALCAALEGLRSTSIESLNLSGNQLCKFSANDVYDLFSTFNGTELRSINLSWNHLHYLDFKVALPGLIGSKVSHINIDHTSFGNTQIKRLEELFSGFRGTNLKSIELSSAALGWLSDKRLQAALEFLVGTPITDINLANNFLALQGSEALRIALSGFKETNVCSLDLSANDLGGLSPADLKIALGGLPQTISKLHLSKNFDFSLMTEEEREGNLSAIPNFIRTLYFCENGLSETEGDIQSFLRSLPDLECIIMNEASGIYLPAFYRAELIRHIEEALSSGEGAPRILTKTLAACVLPSLHPCVARAVIDHFKNDRAPVSQLIAGLLVEGKITLQTIQGANDGIAVTIAEQKTVEQKHFEVKAKRQLRSEQRHSACEHYALAVADEKCRTLASHRLQQIESGYNGHSEASATPSALLLSKPLPGLAPERQNSLANSSDSFVQSLSTRP